MPKNGKKTPWEILTKYPPVFVRLYAKERSGSRMHCALSDEEIAIRGKLPLEKVRSISRETSWDNVKIGDAERFCIGCNFDPFNYLDRNRISAYSKRCTWAFLRRSDHWNTTFLPLIKIFQNAQNSQN
jgi:hypothetical protein